MRTFKRNLLIGLMIILAAVGIFAGCGSEENNGVTIRFETNGGEQIESVVVERGQEYTLPTPVYKAHSFEGWYTTETFDSAVVTKVIAENDMTVYAKWEQMYPITLELNGGKLSETELYLKAGQNVYDFMKERIPTLDDDHAFGAWFVNGQELSAGTVMTSAGITLTARYKVKFTVQPYLQTDDGYEKADVYVGYGYEDTYPECEITGYVENHEHEGSDAWRKLSPNAAANTFTVYYDRKTLNVYLIPNLPEDGADAEIRQLSVPYGTTIDLPTDFSVEDYCLAGWSTEPTGAVVYGSTYLYDHLFDKEGMERPEGFTALVDNQTLYAVWEQGYIDMFGGDDVIYRFDESANTVYICRNGIFLKATFNSSGEFLIRAESGDIVQRGKLNEGNTFIYRDNERDGQSYYLYEDRAINRDVELLFDGYNGVTYTQPAEDGVHTDTSSGTYSLATAEDGTTELYIATFTSGLLQGQTLTIRIGYALEEDDLRVSAFQIRANEDVALGTLYRFVDNQRYYPEVYLMTLNGFGTAFMSVGDQTSSFYYKREGDVVTLYNSRDEVTYVLYLAQMSEMKGYYVFEEALAHTFTLEGGVTLTLDGLYSATYDAGSGPVEGTYVALSSRLGGRIVEFTYDGNQTKQFYLTTVTSEDGESVSYELKELTERYGEYLYAGSDGGFYYIPLLVLDADGAGTVSLYGYPGVQTYSKFADGTYLYNEDSGLYALTLTAYYPVENMNTGLQIDFSQVTSLVFGTLYGSGVNAFYVYSVTLTGQDPTQYNEIYYSGEDTLTLVSAFAFYKTAEGTVIGQYSRSGNVLSFTAGERTYRFELVPEAHTCELLTLLYGTTYAMAAGSTDRTKSLVFDGKGGVVYHDTALELTVSGTYREAEDKTNLGDTYFVFTAEDPQYSFDFMLYSSSSSALFVRRDTVLEGDYLSETGESLVLDGFAKASYTAAGSEPLTGTYVYSAEGEMVRITVDGSRILYIDLKADKMFSLRGPEYTSICLCFDNQSIVEEVYFSLDGYGNLTAHNGANGEVIDDAGTYRALEGTRYLFTYRGADGTTVEIFGVLGIATVNGSSYLAIIVEHEGVAGAYVNGKDMTVLNLDAHGNAVRYDTMGRAETGRYLLVTETMLYYYSDADACIYTFNVTRGTATPAKFTAYGYYTKDLEALNFTEYGYVYVEGVRCYFTVEDGNVIIYRAAREGESEVNIYGFVEDRSFGPFSQEKTYNGKVYYRSDGYNITFARAEANKDKYPIFTQAATEEGQEDVYSPIGSLTFSPVGNGEFTVEGRVTIGDMTNRPCVVVRILHDDGPAELYLRIAANVGYYRFDLSIEYYGDSTGPGVNVYSITDMKYIVDLPSYTYLYYDYLINMMSGGTMGVRNVFGDLVVTKLCDEGGKITDEAYLDFTLGEAMSITDYEGNVFELHNVAFEEGTGTVNYTATAVGKDGYTYMFRFARSYFQYTRQYGFNIYSITRLQTFEDVELGDGTHGRLEVERLIYSDLAGASAGSIWSISLYDAAGQLLESENYSYLQEGIAYYIVRQRDEDGLITETTYYKIALEEEVITETDDPHAGRVPPYKGVSVTQEEMSTVYSADGNTYADIDGENKIVLFVTGNTVYLVDSCTYDEGTDTYELTTLGGRKYRVSKDEAGKLIFEELVEEPAE